MELVRERQTIEFTNVEAQQHNAQISERYRLLQSAEADQFSQVTYANETPAQVASTVEETPVLEQMPHVTDFVHESPVSPIFTAEKFESFLELENVSYAEVYLPKFECEYSTEMEDILKNLGIEKAFGAEADFSALGSASEGPLYIQGVKHNTFISVDELGTRAGAVTVISGGCGGMPPAEQVYFDRPFVYFIVDRDTKMPVFAGVAADIGK